MKENVTEHFESPNTPLLGASDFERDGGAGSLERKLEKEKSRGQSLRCAAIEGTIRRISAQIGEESAGSQALTPADQRATPPPAGGANTRTENGGAVVTLTRDPNDLWGLRVDKHMRLDMARLLRCGESVAARSEPWKHLRQRPAVRPSPAADDRGDAASRSLVSVLVGCELVEFGVALQGGGLTQGGARLVELGMTNSQARLLLSERRQPADDGVVTLSRDG
eukprot:gene5921-23148_t